MNAAPLISSLFGLVAAIAWGTADFFAAKASKRNSPETTAVWASIIGAIAYVILFLFNPGHSLWTQSGILFAAAAGVSLEVGLLLFYRGLAAGPVSIVSPISSAYPLVTTLIFVFVFGGSLHITEVVGIFVITTGILITSGLLDIKKSETKLTRGVGYGLMTFMLWGAAYALLGKAVSQLGWEKAMLVDICTGLLTLFIILAYTSAKQLNKSLRGKYYKDRYILAAAFLQLLGGIIFSVGLRHASSSAVITAVAASYPALTMFLAIKHLGEKKRIWSLVGAFATIAGVIVLSV